MIGPNGSGKVTVNKGRLITTISQNKDKHVAEFTEAHRVYVDKRVELIKELSEMASKSPTGLSKKILELSTLPKPISYESYYTKVLRLLDYSVQDQVEIDAQAFDNYVNDEWSWTKSFKSVLSNYT